jgi:hypothetical protein
MKTFTTLPTRTPRNITKDPAFKAAADAFPEAPSIPTTSQETGDTSLPPAPHTVQISTQRDDTVTLRGQTPDSILPIPSTENINGKYVEIPSKPEINSVMALVPQTTQQNKMTIYPGDMERKRLFTIRHTYRIAESIIAEYAIEQFFLRHTDQEIASALHARGHSLRRKKQP